MPHSFDKESAFAQVEKAIKEMAPEMLERVRQFTDTRHSDHVDRTASIREAGRENIRSVLYDALGALKRGNTLSAQRSIEDAIDWLDQI